MIRFATIGSNFVTDRFLTAAKQAPYFTLLGIYSRTPTRATEYATKWGAPRTYTSLDALCADADIDAVYVASPNTVHEEQVIPLLRAGKHVLCEKPAALDSASLLRMHEEAKKNGLIFMEAMMPAHSPAWKTVLSLLPEIGTLRHAELKYCQYSSRYDKFKAGIIENAFNPEMGGGALMDIGVYCLHAAQMLFGEPEGVTGAGIFLPASIDGAGSLVLSWKDKLAEIVYSKITDSASGRIDGEKGSILLDSVSLPRRITLHLRGQEPIDVPFEMEFNEMRYELDDFVHQIECGENPVFFENTLAVTRTLDRARALIGIDFKPH